MNDPELHQILPQILTWQIYESAVKTDLFSTVLLAAQGLFLIDPIPVPRINFSKTDLWSRQ